MSWRVDRLGCVVFSLTCASWPLLIKANGLGVGLSRERRSSGILSRRLPDIAVCVLQFLFAGVIFASYDEQPALDHAGCFTSLIAAVMALDGRRPRFYIRLL